MAMLFIKPLWFQGFDIALEIIFAVITIAVSIIAFKLYRLTSERRIKLLATSFLLMALAYVVLFITNIATLVTVVKAPVIFWESLQKLIILNNVGVYLYIVLFLAGLTAILYMTLNVYQTRIYWLLLLPLLIALVFILNKLFLFYIFSSLILIFIVWYYFKCFRVNRHTSNTIIFVAFFFLFLGRVHFIFSINNALFYVLGHFLELIAYLLILFNLLIAMKKGVNHESEKRKTTSHL
ncbi:hypothetical protein C4573_02695 [Candidatus Woesearchaeota archaeon]|nr:MAG: hypothetical protein C4573_02695 [Candidatus Woesearchaeota archaeon]